MTYYGPDITKNSAAVIEWIDRMQRRFGYWVHGRGGRWDWGQALCVEMYGTDHRTWPDSPADADVQRALAWEQGNWPDWVEDPRPKA